MDIFDQISKEAQKAGEFIVEKATIAKDFTVATWNSAEIRNRIEKLYKAIGKAVYAAHTTEAENAEEIEGYIEEINALKIALKEKEEVRQGICNRKTCPACDKAINKDSVYCPHCGVQVK